VRKRRSASAEGLGVVEGWHPVPVSGVENAAYYYSTYNAPDTMPVSNKPKMMVLGGAPTASDRGSNSTTAACMQRSRCATKATSDHGQLQPETVSTDYDTSNRLYFEPLTVEDVLAIYEKEKPQGVIVQFGGQTPLNIAASWLTRA